MVRANGSNRQDRPGELGLPGTRLSDSDRLTGGADGTTSGLQRFTAFLLFFLIVVPLILFVLAFAAQLWGWVVGDGPVLDTWTILALFPLGLLVSPVSFYLGWYYQALAKGQRFDLHKAMGGHFIDYCRSIYGLLAAVTLLLATIGALGSAFVDSSLIVVSWVVIAFVGVGIVSWLFEDIGGNRGHAISLKPTGIAFVLFSAVWLFFCFTALVHQDWAQLQGGIILFLIFLIPGVVALRLSSPGSSPRSQPPRGDSDSRV